MVTASVFVGDNNSLVVLMHQVHVELCKLFFFFPFSNFFSIFSIFLEKKKKKKQRVGT